MAIQISGCPVIDNSRNLTNIANATTAATANTYVLRGADGKICADSVPPIAIRGAFLCGGYLMCCSSSVYWIVAPASSEVSRTWYCRNDANTTAQQVSGCTGWFVPTCAQLRNPGFTCRTHWQGNSEFSSYWSDTVDRFDRSCYVNFCNGNSACCLNTVILCVRSFRCVTY